MENNAIQKTNHTSLTTRDYALCGLFAAVLAVCSWIAIPTAVPFTLQTFGVFLAVGLLGGKRGTITVLVWLLLGAIGLPVFTGFTGGIGHLFGVTGGYLIGLIFSALIMWAFESIFGNSAKVLFISMILGLLLCYAFGTAWFIVVYARETGPIGIGAALSMCVVPFIIPDLIKICLATLLSVRLRPLLHSYIN